MYFDESVAYLENKDFDANGNFKYSMDVPMVVIVLASWCGYCKSFAPIFQEFARQTNGKNVLCACIQADGDASEQQLASRVKQMMPRFMGFPHVALIKDGMVVKEYDGDRTLKSLYSFLQQK